ncbi:MAG: capsule biosynthesis protein [Pseudomonadota bacterium]
MADDGRVGSDPKERKQDNSKTAAAEAQPTQSDQVHPGDLPKYEDPHGRMITLKHKRMATRTITAMGLEAYNANHAMHMLSERGIDPLEARATMLEITREAGKPSGGQLAVMRSPDEENALVDPNMKSAEEKDLEREQAIQEIQRGLIARRRKRLFGLFLRLVVFVALPTIAMGYYYIFIATNMYETESKFVIQTSENPSAASGGLGGLLAGTGFATSQDSVVVQEYLTSREAFARLNRDFGYMRHFQDPSIDVIQRLPQEATIDDAYSYFTKKVTIGYDPTEGIVRMAVVATTPEASQRFSEALVGYAEERVDGLTREARGDQLETALKTFREAEQATIENELRVQELQQQSGVLSAEVELSSQMSLINALELEREQKRLALSQILDNPRPNPSQVAIAEAEIERIVSRIAELRRELTQGSASSSSLSKIGSELRSAELRLATSQLILQESIAAVTNARTEATRQVRYLSMGVSPIAPLEPTYPRKVENTLLAFVVFMGIYIMASLTVSILREQVSV